MALRMSEEEWAVFQRQRGQGAGPPISERAFQAAILRLAKQEGYLVYHTYRSTRSPQGYPDITLCHPTRRESPIFLCELKTATGQVTQAQAAWVEALDARTTVSAVWRPDDMEMIRRWLMT